MASNRRFQSIEVYALAQGGSSDCWIDADVQNRSLLEAVVIFIFWIHSHVVPDFGAFSALLLQLTAFSGVTQAALRGVQIARRG